MKRFDSIIFDMDGTLWDAVDSYAAVWCEAYRRLGVDHTTTRAELLDCMGKPLSVIFDIVRPPQLTADYDTFATVLREAEGDLMPRLGGRLYPSVREGLHELRRLGYRLFMVSNCGPRGLTDFVAASQLEGIFTDLLSHGSTGLLKTGNIELLRERYSLEAPVYVGDIQADADDAHRAGVPFVWARYGFGSCSDADFAAGSFDELVRLFSTSNVNSH